MPLKEYKRQKAKKEKKEKTRKEKKKQEKCLFLLSLTQFVAFSPKVHIQNSELQVVQR